MAVKIALYLFHMLVLVAVLHLRGSICHLCRFLFTNARKIYYQLHAVLLLLQVNDTMTGQ